MDSLKTKLMRARGLSVNTIYDDEYNAQIIKFIIDEYLSFTALQYSPRSTDEWQTVMDLPTNFNSYRYRMAQ